MPADGTLVESYLVSRGLHLPPPPTLRVMVGYLAGDDRAGDARV
jgi:hypothetical protein